MDSSLFLETIQGKRYIEKKKAKVQQHFSFDRSSQGDIHLALWLVFRALDF